VPLRGEVVPDALVGAWKGDAPSQQDEEHDVGHEGRDPDGLPTDNPFNYASQSAYIILQSIMVVHHLHGHVSSITSTKPHRTHKHTTDRLWSK